VHRIDRQSLVYLLFTTSGQEKDGLNQAWTLSCIPEVLKLVLKCAEIYSMS